MQPKGSYGAIGFNRATEFNGVAMPNGASDSDETNES